MRSLTDLFAALDRSAFRRGFTLSAALRRYVREKSLALIADHARRFVAERLAPAAPANDGRQTPKEGHPVFVAQHATATCCRGCLEKWHGIGRGSALSPQEVDYIVGILEAWIRRQMSEDSPAEQKDGPRQPSDSRPAQRLFW